MPPVTKPVDTKMTPDAVVSPTDPSAPPTPEREQIRGRCERRVDSHSLQRQSSISLLVSRASRNMGQDAFKISQVVSFVLVGWMLAIFCTYWQYQIIKPYFLALLWACIVSTSLRKFCPLVRHMAGAVTVAITKEKEANCPKGMAKHALDFMWRPFGDFWAKGLTGSHHSGVFLAMLGRCWITLLVTFLSRNMLTMSIMVGLGFVMLAKCMVISVFFGRMFNMTMARVTKFVLVIVAVFIFVAIFVHTLLQSYYECLALYSFLRSFLPSTPWLRSVIDNTMDRVNDANLVDFDFCGVVKTHLGLESDLQFESSCKSAHDYIRSVVAPNTSSEACQALGVNTFTAPNATGCVSEGPFKMLSRIFEGKARKFVSQHAPMTYEFGHAALVYLGFRHIVTEFADNEEPKSMSPTLTSLWIAAKDSFKEMQSVASGIPEYIRLETFAGHAHTTLQNTVSVSWKLAYALLLSVVAIASKFFDVLFKIIVFLSATLHLYLADHGILEHLGSILESVDQTRGRQLYEGLDDAIGAVLGAPLKLALFEAFFTCLLLLCCGSFFICIPTAAVAIISVVFPSLAGLCPFIYAGSLFLSGAEVWKWSLVTILSFFAWWYVPDAIYAEINHPYLTGLAIVMGASCLGPIGFIIGPVLIVVPYTLLKTMTKEGPDFVDSIGEMEPPNRLRGRASSRLGEFGDDLQSERP